MVRDGANAPPHHEESVALPPACGRLRGRGRADSAPLPPRSGGEGLGVGGLSACDAGSEFAEAPPTPDPSPPRASRAGGGEKKKSGPTGPLFFVVQGGMNYPLLPITARTVSSGPKSSAPST